MAIHRSLREKRLASVIIGEQFRRVRRKGWQTALYTTFHDGFNDIPYRTKQQCCESGSDTDFSYLGSQIPESTKTGGWTKVKKN